jgi:hypothetical protein
MFQENGGLWTLRDVTPVAMADSNKTWFRPDEADCDRIGCKNVLLRTNMMRGCIPAVVAGQDFKEACEKHVYLLSNESSQVLQISRSKFQVFSPKKMGMDITCGKMSYQDLNVEGLKELVVPEQCKVTLDDFILSGPEFHEREKGEIVISVGIDENFTEVKNLTDSHWKSVLVSLKQLEKISLQKVKIARIDEPFDILAILAKYKWLIVAGVAVVLCLLTGICIYRRRKNRHALGSNTPEASNQTGQRGRFFPRFLTER